MAPRIAIPRPALRGDGGSTIGWRAQGGGERFDRRTVRWIRLRLRLTGVIFLFVFGIIAWRAFDLQAVQQGRFSQMAEDQALREQVLTPRRGRITDRNGEALALSVDVDSIAVDPTGIADAAVAARALGRALKIPADKVLTRIERGRHFAWIKRRVSPEEATAVRALGLPGVIIRRESRRFYPYRELAAHVLGFAGIDGRGLEGLELTLDERLRGTPRSTPALRDARGNHLLAEAAEVEHLGGGEVVLTLDRTIQYHAENALDRAVREAEAAAGVAVVLDPRTGRILALVNRPAFNPNDPGQSQRATRRNRAVTDIYEPGSVFKMFTTAAALDAGAASADDVFDCQGGAARIGGHTIHDSHAYGELSVGDIIKLSSNIGSAQIAARLGKERLVEYLGRFGFGTRTGLQLPGEQSGRVRPARSLSDVGLATVSFGQGVSATPLQVAAGVAALANGGRLMRPYIVQEIRDDRGEVVMRREPELVRSVVSEPVARAVSDMLTSVTEPGGTGTRAAIPGYRVAGKTGTSQKPDPLTGGYSVDKRIASFAGYVPADQPRLVVLVVIDEPQGSKYGGVVAAPVFREIAENALRYLGVPPTEPVDEAEDALALADQEEGEGIVLPTSLVPPPEGKTLVPDLAGMDLGSAVQLLAERHLQARPEGAGVVIQQRPGAGAIVAPGEAIEVRLAPRG